MRVNGRLDGHIVQGHVDTTARCTGVEQLDGSRRFTFAYDIDPALERKGYGHRRERLGYRQRRQPYRL